MPPESPAFSGEEAEKVEDAAEEADVLGETFDTSPLDDFPVCRNSFSLVPTSTGRFLGLKTLRFFSNELFPPVETDGLATVERLQDNVPSLGMFGKDLELSRIPLRPSTFTLLGDFSGLRCLTKLSVCHFSIRYLPPEIGFLKKLEDLDLSFNKLKKLPNAISGLSALKLLRVANNKLIDLPIGLSNLSQLERLDLSNNRLASLESLNFDSLQALQFLNVQYNILPDFCEVPSRICCKMEGNNGVSLKEADISFIEVDIINTSTNHSSHGPCSRSSSMFISSRRPHASQKMPKGGKHRDSLQEIARQECLNYSRNFKGGHAYNNNNNCMTMIEGGSLCKLSTVGNENSELQCYVNKGVQTDCLSKSTSGTVYLNIEVPDLAEQQNSWGSEYKCRGLSDSDTANCFATVTSESTGSGKPTGHDSEVDSHSCCQANQTAPCKKDSNAETSKLSMKSKRHYDKDIDNPKPKKYRRPIDELLKISFKYSSESFCSTEDHLPDGFYDAGRDRPFRPLENYLDDSCLDSREVILLDRGRDEELDAIVLTAQILLSRLKAFSDSTERNMVAISDFQRASVLALFVSDCFGGSDRSISISRMRRAVVGSNKEQPFICTCSATSSYEKKDASQQTFGLAGSFNFTDLCENSLWMIKDTWNSNVVPIGNLRFGVCRHRAVLMKYLCDRMDPPIPCELVRGYLDFMPHAWNIILVMNGQSWLRMVVDACYPTDIREESDPEYFCRYIPLSRVLTPSVAENPGGLFGCSFPSLLFTPLESDKPSHNCIRRCKFGTLDAAAKIKNIDACKVSDEVAKIFEYTFLGEVRMLSSLRNHSCIVEIYGHKLSSKWVAAADGKEHRLFESLIIMEYMKGGSLKSYIEKLSKRGENHVPIDLALHIARSIACALVEIHGKHIIHRDIKSENVLIDFGSKRTDGFPVVKLSDFDRAVPFQSFLHTCCIAHVGVHPPDTCVGTPRWMAPEVLQAMNRRLLYGLEVDIWSYGCLLLELLTLQIPYRGLLDSEIYDLLQMKQRPRLSPDIERFALSKKLGKTNSFSGPSYSDEDSEKLMFLVELFKRCTCGDPAERPTARQILDMFNDILPQSSQ